MKTLIILTSAILLCACDPDITVPVPGFGQNSILEDSNPLSADARQRMQGVYRVISGSDRFGDRMVLRWSGNHLSLFGEKNTAYFILQGGSLESVVFFEGYWRYATGTQTGLADFRISGDTGGEFLVQDGDSTAVVLNGTFGSDNGLPDKIVRLQYERPLSPLVTEREFWIVAHRGAGRTSDLLPASENSLEMIALAERYGANAIEIDVKMSQDRVPFLYHDATINLRLTRKGPIWGDIEDFSFAQLRSFVTLINGEKIPSLREALEFVLEETTLGLVWLDMKSGKNDFPEVIAIQQEMQQRASDTGRDLEILLGLPNDRKIGEFKQYPGFENILSLNEVSITSARETGSGFWGPRWTQGTQLADVRLMQGEGRRVITWTMDESDFIKQFLAEGEFDGILTNYPSVVAYHYYIRQ